MLELDHLTVSGDVTFGKDVTLKVWCTNKINLHAVVPIFQCGVFDARVLPKHFVSRLQRDQPYEIKLIIMIARLPVHITQLLQSTENYALQQFTFLTSIALSLTVE